MDKEESLCAVEEVARVDEEARGLDVVEVTRNFVVVVEGRVVGGFTADG